MLGSIPCAETQTHKSLTNISDCLLRVRVGCLDVGGSLVDGRIRSENQLRSKKKIRMAEEENGKPVCLIFMSVLLLLCACSAQLYRPSRSGAVAYGASKDAGSPLSNH